MANYKFDNLNNGADLIDPTVEFPTLISWDRNTKLGVILCVLTATDGSKFAVELGPINIPTVNGGTMDALGAIALAAFEV